jgi:hypothetical protein
LPELNSQTKFGFNPNDHPKSRTYKVFTAMPRGRPKGAKSVKTRIAIARAELAAKAPPIDYSMPIDSLDIMERVMRHFYQRAMIEQSIGVQADWKKVDSLMMQTAQVAEKVARYKHAALSAVKLAGDISTRSAMESMSLDELLVRIKTELAKLGPLIDLEAIWEPRGSRTERGLSKSVLPAGRSGT